MKTEEGEGGRRMDCRLMVRIKSVKLPRQAWRWRRRTWEGGGDGWKEYDEYNIILLQY